MTRREVVLKDFQFLDFDVELVSNRVELPKNYPR